MPFTITRTSAPRNILPTRPASATEIKLILRDMFPAYRFELWDETGDGEEIYIVLANHNRHIRFHVKREGF